MPAIYIDTVSPAFTLYAMNNTTSSRIIALLTLMICSVGMTFGWDINQKNFRGYTDLHRAALGGDYREVSRLISKGAEVNTVNEWGTSPMEEAIKHRYPKVAEILLQAGAYCPMRFFEKYDESYWLRRGDSLVEGPLIRQKIEEYKEWKIPYRERAEKWLSSQYVDACQVANDLYKSLPSASDAEDLFHYVFGMRDAAREKVITRIRAAIDNPDIDHDRSDDSEILCSWFSSGDGAEEYYEEIISIIKELAQKHAEDPRFLFEASRGLCSEAKLTEAFYRAIEGIAESSKSPCEIPKDITDYLLKRFLEEHKAFVGEPSLENLLEVLQMRDLSANEEEGCIDLIIHGKFDFRALVSALAYTYSPRWGENGDVHTRAVTARDIIFRLIARNKNHSLSMWMRGYTLSKDEEYRKTVAEFIQKTQPLSWLDLNLALAHIETYQKSYPFNAQEIMDRMPEPSEVEKVLILGEGMGLNSLFGEINPMLREYVEENYPSDFSENLPAIILQEYERAKNLRKSDLQIRSNFRLLIDELDVQLPDAFAVKLLEYAEELESHIIQISPKESFDNSHFYGFIKSVKDRLTKDHSALADIISESRYPGSSKEYRLLDLVLTHAHANLDNASLSEKVNGFVALKNDKVLQNAYFKKFILPESQALDVKFVLYLALGDYGSFPEFDMQYALDRENLEAYLENVHVDVLVQLIQFGVDENECRYSSDVRDILVHSISKSAGTYKDYMRHLSANREILEAIGAVEILQGLIDSKFNEEYYKDEL